MTPAQRCVCRKASTEIAGPAQRRSALEAYLNGTSCLQYCQSWPTLGNDEAPLICRVVLLACCSANMAREMVMLCVSTVKARIGTG